MYVVHDERDSLGFKDGGLRNMLVTKLSQEGALRASCNRCLEHDNWSDNTKLNWLTAQMGPIASWP